MHDWLNRDHVKEFWDGPQSIEEVQKKYLMKIESKSIFPHLVFLDEKPIGYIQSYIALEVGDGWWEGQPEGTWGVDQFIGEEDYIGKGYGTKFIKLFTDQLLKRNEVTQVITDPAPNNPRAIRSYEKAGFVIKEEMDTPDGKCVLMVKSPMSF